MRARGQAGNILRVMSLTCLDHFGLRRAPFGSAPEPALFHASQPHRRVLDWIGEGVAAGAPVLSLTGVAGTGKTALLKLLADRRHGNGWITGLVSALQSRPGGIPGKLRDAFGLPDGGGGPGLSDQFRRFAETNRANGHPTLLMVDDAQALEVADIAALASLAVEGGLTLLLAGRPELRGRLAAPGLRFARGAHAVLTPMGEGDTAGYVAHRLAQSGATAPIFNTGAMQVLHFFGLGLPRLINVMADHCLRTAAAAGLSRIDGAWAAALLDEASATGVLSRLAEQATGSDYVATIPPAPSPEDQTAVAAPHPPVSDGTGIPDHAEPPALADGLSPLAAAHPGLPAAPGTHASQERPARRSDTLRSLPRHDPVPTPALHEALFPPRREGGGRLVRWLGAAFLACGAAWVWLQWGQAPAPAAMRPAPAVGAAMDQTASAARQPAAVPPQPAFPVPGAAAITPEPAIPALMAQALELDSRDPARAAIAYARAALRGSARAAYYLGQLHETGTGAAPDPGTARLWYAAAPGLPGPQQRLQALTAADAPGTPAAPVPVFQARPGGGSEMIWRLPGGVPSVRFRVEVFGPAGQPLPVQETRVPGLILPFPVSAWRVTAIGADGSESAPSALVRMIPATE